MTIKRTHKLFQKEYLKKNNHLKILDLGCTHVNYWEEANHFADIVDYTKQFSEKNLNFTLLGVDKKLPFKDKEFDYVILSHVLEHVPNINEFCQEVERIAKAGYIELPTILEDNIVLSTNSSDDHKWMFKFDDVEKVLLVEKKKQLIEPFITHGVLFDSLRKNFRSSLVLELYWENKIDFDYIENKITNKISLITLLRKFFSKKIRTILR